MRKIILFSILFSSLALVAKAQPDCDEPTIRFAPLAVQYSPQFRNVDMFSGIWIKVAERGIRKIGIFPGVKFFDTWSAAAKSTRQEKLRNLKTDSTAVILTATVSAKVHILYTDYSAYPNELMLLPYVQAGKNYYEAGAKLGYMLMRLRPYGIPTSGIIFTLSVGINKTHNVLPGVGFMLINL